MLNIDYKPIRHLINSKFLDNYKNNLFTPDKEDLFNTFSLPLKDIKVVIIGQDPYPQKGVANGYAFDYKTKDKPKSYVIIEKEILRNYDKCNIKEWKKQGVFSLNVALSTQIGKTGLHYNIWRPFIEATINLISSRPNKVFILLGSKAMEFIPYIRYKQFIGSQSKKSIDEIKLFKDRNYILTTKHPASEIYKTNAGFIGSNVFYYSNVILKRMNTKKIIW